MRILHIILFSCLFLPLSNAQLSIGGFPESFKTTLNGDVPEVIMPDIPIGQIILEDAIFDTMDMPWRFAYPMEVSFNLTNSGRWEKLPDGSRIWRLKVTCKGAISINFLYDHFYLPEGGKLYLYQEDKSQVLGAFTQRNNKKHGKFATALINDESAILEYYEPRNSWGKGIISIAQVSHGYRSIGLMDDRGLGDSGACQVNVNCSPEGDDWQDEKRGVAKIVVNGSGLCSGSLLNNTAEDCTPYFLTADHCIGSLDAVTNPDASNWVFYWNFERPSCDNSGAVPEETSSGATLVANDSPSDFALFQLTENPADSYTVYFNGYNATNTTGQGGVGIHHPSGDAKKIATHDLSPTDAGWGGSGPAGSHWNVLPWSATPNGHSVTEGGSSGSPLFDANSRVIGQLHGGSSINCSDPPNDPGIYGKVSWSWENSGATDSRRRLFDWLDPVGGGTITTLDGTYGSCSEPVVSFISSHSTMFEAEADEDNFCLDYKEYQVYVRISREPSADAFISLDINGTATEGLNADYEISPSLIILNSANMTDFFTVKVYDDAYVEPNEDISLEIILDANGGDAVLSPTLFQHSAIIRDNDPDVSPDFEYLVFETPFSNGYDGFTSINPGGGDLWVLGTAEDASSQYFTVPDNASGQLVYVNDDACDCNMDMVSLISPNFDFSPYDSVFYTFNTYFLGDSYQGNTESAKLQISVNGGSFSDVPGGIIEGAPGWRELTYDLTAYNAESNIQIAIVYSDGSGWLYGMAVDNVRLHGIAPIQIQTEANVADFDEEYLGPLETVHFFDENSGKLMATIVNQSFHDFGCTQVFIDRGGDDMSTTYPFANSNPINHPLNKSFRIIPEFNNTASSYDLILYYTDEEIDFWMNQTGGDLSDLLIIKVAEASVAAVNPSNFGNFAVTTSFVDHSNLLSNHVLKATFHNGFSGFVAGPEPTPLLPVDLFDFKLNYKNQIGVNLWWNVGEEIDVHKYQIERSENAIDFSAIGHVLADLSKTYSYIDPLLLKGRYYYRIKIIDQDQSFAFSQIRTVDIRSEYNLSIFPNPASHNIYIQAEKEIVEIQLFDQTGKQVSENHLISTLQSKAASISIQHLHKGIYMLMVNMGDKIHWEKIIIT